MRTLDSADLKRRIPLEAVFQYYGSSPDQQGRWRCLFPDRHQHGDQHHSVGIKQGRATCWSQRCFRKADQFEIVGLVEGLREFPDQKRRILEIGGLIPPATSRMTPTPHALASANDEKPRIMRNILPPGELGKTVFLYHDASGNPVAVVQRIELGDGEKSFRQWGPTANGSEWQCSMQHAPQPRPLYHLPDVLARPEATVFIHEGEKAGEAARVAGLPGVHTTTIGGATNAKQTDFSPLRGRDVVVCLDHDEAGEQYGQEAARLADQAGAKSVRLLRLPGLPPKGDVVEWLETGGTVAEFEAAIRQAEQWIPARFTEGARLSFTPLRDLLAEADDATQWLVTDRLPMAGLSLLAGKPKAGKSTLARCLALAVARGTLFLGWPTAQGVVFYLALEEKRGEVRRHFRTMGALHEDDIRLFIDRSPQNGLGQLCEAAEQERPALIIVDPLFKLVRVKDGNDYAQVSAALEPLLSLARRTGAHVLAVHHLGKGDREGGDSILGSTAILAAVDSALLLKRSEKYRTLSSIQRYGEELEEITLSLDPETRTVAAGPTRAEADQAHTADAIVEFLRLTKEPVEEKIILDQVEGRRGVKVKALRRLLDSKRVVKFGKGGKGDPFRYALPYRAHETAQQDSCSLVPTLYREQVNKNPQNVGTAQNLKGDSCSRETGLMGSCPQNPSMSREQESEEVIVVD